MTLGNINSALGTLYQKDITRRLQAQQAHETLCLKPLETLQLLMDDITRAPQLPELDFQLTSPFQHLKVVHDQAPGQFTISTIEELIRMDHSLGLTEWLEKNKLRLLDTFPTQLQNFVSGILSLSISSGAWKCAETLASNELVLESASVDQEFLISIIKDLNWSTKREDHISTEESRIQYVDKSLEDAKTKAFAQILESFGPRNPHLLWKRDRNGRTPLHYSGKYGLVTICHSILEFLHTQRGNPSVEREALLIADDEGLTPLHWSILHGHIETTRKFLAVFNTDVSNISVMQYDYLRRTLSGLLLIALKHNNSAMACLLASSHIDMSYQSSTGETALYVAAETGCEEFVKMILEARSHQGVDIDIRENFHGWTPLFIACVRGFCPVAELLLQAGACGTLTDTLGWTAKEHAVFRGHFPITELCGLREATEVITKPAQLPTVAKMAQKYHLQAGGTYVLINLGVLQDGRQTKPVNFYKNPFQKTGRAYIDARMSLEVSTSAESHTSHITRLPLLDDPIDDTIILPVDNFSDASLDFKLFSASLSSTGELSSTLVGRGIFLLQESCKCFGAQRETLIREHCVPILGTEVMNFLGIVTFSYVVARPFPHLMIPTPSFATLDQPDLVQLVGHRGKCMILILKSYYLTQLKG